MQQLLMLLHGIFVFFLSDPAYIVNKVKPVKLEFEQAQQLVECLSLENCGVNLSSTDASEICFEWLSKRSPDSSWCEVVEALVTVQGLGYLVSHLLPPSKLNSSYLLCLEVKTLDTNNINWLFVTVWGKTCHISHKLEKLNSKCILVIGLDTQGTVAQDGCLQTIVISINDSKHFNSGSVDPFTVRYDTIKSGCACASICIYLCV